jgi:hypothetical protein
MVDLCVIAGASLYTIRTASDPRLDELLDEPDGSSFTGGSSFHRYWVQVVAF